MMSTLVLFSPRIACRSDHNRKYLRCVYEKGGSHGGAHDTALDKSKSGIRIDASAEHVAGSARTRFYVDKFDDAKRLVHIRCAYNDKFWVPQEVKDDDGRAYWVIGTAHEPEEDLSKPSCTLFEYTALSDISYRFYHPGLRKYICSADKPNTYLQLRDEKDEASDTFTVIGLSRQKELPKYAVFKGDNDLYLKLYPFVDSSAGLHLIEDYYKIKYYPKYAFLQFGENNKRLPSVLHTTSTNDEGLVRIQSFDNGMFWKHHPDFVRASSSEENFNDPYTLFKVISGGDGFTVLQNVGSEKYCKRLTGYGEENTFTGFKKVSCLSAVATYIGDFEKLKVEEPVTDRHIFDVTYHIDEARIHDMGTFLINEDPHYNPRDSPETFTVSQTITTTVETKWESTLSVKTGEEIRNSFGVGIEFPLPKKGSLKLSGEHSQSQTNETTRVESEGGSTTETKQVTTSQNVTLAPKTTTTVKYLKKHFHYDIPFSYKETAILMMDGKELETVLHDDGLCTIDETYNTFIVE